jgi:hypothetical protein
MIRVIKHFVKDENLLKQVRYSDGYEFRINSLFFSKVLKDLEKIQEALKGIKYNGSKIEEIIKKFTIRTFIRNGSNGFILCSGKKYTKHMGTFFEDFGHRSSFGNEYDTKHLITLATGIYMSGGSNPKPIIKFSKQVFIKQFITEQIAYPENLLFDDRRNLLFGEFQQVDYYSELDRQISYTDSHSDLFRPVDTIDWNQQKKIYPGYDFLKENYKNYVYERIFFDMNTKYSKNDLLYNFFIEINSLNIEMKQNWKHQQQQQQPLQQFVIKKSTKSTKTQKRKHDDGHVLNTNKHVRSTRYNYN